MKRPAISRSSLLFLLTFACSGFCLASTFVSGAQQAQSSNTAIVKSDRKNPRRAPEKSPPGKPPQTVTTKEQSSDSASATRSLTDAAEPAAAGAPPQGCDYHTVLVRDTIRGIFVELYNYPENSAIPVTLTQTNAGIMGFALTDAGPYTPTLDIIVNTDGNGNGTSAPVYAQGQSIGFTVQYADTPYGATSTLNFNVLPQCNCPAIPVLP
jgi:hypothetical protein